MLLAPLTRVLESRPEMPLVWLAKYFFLRSLRVQQLTFEPRDVVEEDDDDNTQTTAAATGIAKHDDTSSSSDDDTDDDDEEVVPGEPVGMDGQVLKFAKHANVVLYGTLGPVARGRHNASNAGGGDGSGSGKSGSGGGGSGSRGHRYRYSRQKLEGCMDVAVTGLLLCRPANIHAWLAVEFCRQSARVEYVSWAGRVVNTSRQSGYIEEQSARHRQAMQPRAESPPPFSPARVR